MALLRTLVRVLAFGAAALLTACNSLATLNGLNALVPGDSGVTRVVEGAAYGPDPRQKLDVYAPAERPGSAPVLVFFYGGSWNAGDRAGYRFVAQAFAAKGFVVVVPDYRLVPAVRFPAFVDDGAAAVRWTVDHVTAAGGNPKRIAVAGHSAGAQIALLLALDRRYTDRAGASGAIKAAVGIAGPYDFLPLDKPASIAAFGDAPDKAATQPIHFVRADAPPALLLAGDADDTVRPRNSIALDDALRRAGARSELKVYPGVGHIGILLAISKPFRGKADVVATASAFLRRVLG